MKLNQYYQLGEQTRFDLLKKSSELRTLREDIKSFFDGFGKAYKQDLFFEQAATLEHLKNAYVSNAYLTENVVKLKGFALYLQDFQGVHDVFIKQSKFNIYALAYIVFRFDHPFEESRHRLLSFIEAPLYLARLAVHRDEIANYFIANFQEVCEDPILMDILLNQLTEMKKRIESNSDGNYKFSAYMSHYILYKLIKQKLSYFARF